MKLAATILFLGSLWSFGQSESFTYCLSPVDSIHITKVYELQSGDSLIKTYSEDYNNTQYKILHLYDTFYSEYNGKYYFVGTNQANVGDQWHPLRYHFMSFQDSSISCPNTMNIEVTSVNQVLFDGVWINEIELLDLDLQYNVTYTYLEGIGVTNGGPLYNLTQQYMCDILFDFPNPIFRNYTRDHAIHHGADTCATVGIQELTKPGKTLIKIIDSIGRQTEDKPNTTLIYIYSDGTTEKVYRME
jgi:hypothetical protein